MADTIRVHFQCSICGKLAGELHLTSGCAGRQPFVAHHFMGTTTEYLNEAQASEVWKLLAKGEPKAIYHYDSLWIPSYCPECNRHYCKDHWLIVPAFDDDFPGWYDCSWGTCPEGHRRMVDD